ncbi:putative GARP complex subunit [Polychaeton citri CBS 116435]|uniref:GARP complex subunit n=1 Tax=Polychaeton citri CBS 116435 TaxID=1314669 RepID=A0A9P4QDK9_9PEZI|nr:putative GARP complex subunit [Polychaeton citri CBS 116435]
MWLERFSGTTPSRNPDRTDSPAPRRSIQLGPSTLSRRPGLNPRTSSLSVASLSGSTDSLPATARIPNGSNLKAELANPPAAGVSDPLDVLSNVLGSVLTDGPDAQYGQPTGAMQVRPTTLLDDIDFGDLSLEEYANAAPTQGTREPATATPANTASDYEKEKDKFEDLHKSIIACDGILKSVETYLVSFQADLAAVSTEIESLQNRSSSLNTKLENRKAVEKLLGPEVEAVAIPPAIVRKITEGAVDEIWVRSLEELEKRSRNIDAKIKEGRGIKAAADSKPLIEDISNKAVERARDYIVSQIKALRSPSINAQVIQQNNFLRHKSIFAFLAKRQPQLAQEIIQAYVNTMRWYYLHNFARYKTALDKLNLHIIDQSDLIAADPQVKRAGRPASMYDAFSLGRRGVALQTTNETAISSYLAEEDKGTHYLETPFRSFNLTLIDNASAEFSFLTEFLGNSGQSLHAINRYFQAIFQPTFAQGHELTKRLIESSHDAIGVLIGVRLNQHFAFELQRRKCPAAEGYINGTSMLLWPRFQQIIDSHVDSIRRATASLSGKPAGSALSLTTSPLAAQQTTAPHPLTQRVANFLQGILSISSEAGDDEPVSNSLTRLRTEFEGFLVKMSKSIADARKREKFLFNNYSLVQTILSDTQGKLADEQKERFDELKDALNVG